MCDDSHKMCNCTLKSNYSSVQQTLGELDFSRGIWAAALDGDYAEVEIFLERKGVQPDTVDSSGYTALHYASRNGHHAVCSLLLKAGASPNIQTTSGGVTPLHRAAYCGHCDVVELLLTRGADPMKEDADGKLAIHKSAEKGNKEITELLLRAAPHSSELEDKRGQKPVDCVPEHCITVRKLFETG